MISIRNLSKSFAVGGGRVFKALDRVSLEISPGEFFVLLGPSGSGKTTLIRCVAGLEQATSGEMTLGANVVYSSDKRIWVRPEDRNIGMVFQSYAVWPHLTVFENIALPLAKGRKRLSSAETKDRVAKVLEAVDLQGLENRPIPMLSGGQQQRVSLARALAVEPDALLMDEPLSNLDARLRVKVREQIKAIAKKFAITVLYVTHDQTEAMALADRIAVMDAGTTVQVGSARELYGLPKTPKVAEFFGDMNWIPGECSELGVVRTPLGPLHVEGPSTLGRVRVGIRPENIILSRTADTATNKVKGAVEDVTFLGERQSVRVNVQGTIIFLHANGALDVTLGEAWIELPPPALRVFPESEFPA